jgi:hypothetical protein
MEKKALGPDLAVPADEMAARMVLISRKKTAEA